MEKEIKNLKKKLKKIFSKKQEILFCYLFGSIAYGKSISESDIDLALYLDKKKVKDFFDKRIELIVEFEKALNRDVDVVILNTAPPFLKFVVLKEGKLIYEKDKSKRIDFELKSLNEYFDYKPILEMYYQKSLSS